MTMNAAITLVMNTPMRTSIRSARRSSGRSRLSTTYAWMNPWPHGVIVVPTVPTTASMYAPLNVPCGISSEFAARGQSGLGEERRDDVRGRDERRRSPTKKYWTRLKLPRLMSVITASAASTELIATGTPNSDSAALMPANSDTVEPRLAAIIVSAANAAQRTPNRSRISPVRPWPVARPIRAPISWVTNSAIWVTRMTHSRS